MYFAVVVLTNDERNIASGRCHSQSVFVFQALLSDILSVLAMTMGAEGAFESLHYRKSGSQDDIGSWGHEYVR